jgi:hypothetical protein
MCAMLRLLGAYDRRCPRASLRLRIIFDGCPQRYPVFQMSSSGCAHCMFGYAMLTMAGNSVDLEAMQDVVVSSGADVLLVGRDV